jgi:hypothetical protein
MAKKNKTKKFYVDVPIIGWDRYLVTAKDENEAESLIRDCNKVLPKHQIKHLGFVDVDNDYSTSWVILEVGTKY